MKDVFASETIRAYIDRHLGAADEQRFEEAMLMDEALADQVQAEMALRRGFAELARREQAQAPRQGSHRTAASGQQVRRSARRSGRNRLIPFAAAAALFAFAAVPTWMMVQNREDQAAMEARITARLDSTGQHAAYELPASYVTTSAVDTATDDGPVRIRLPDTVREVSLELPSSDLSSPTRLRLAHVDSPNSSVTLVGQPLVDAKAMDFRIRSDRLLPGKYRVVVERQQGDNWIADREFTLNIDGAQR